MSGHSKWNNIKRKKEKTDAQKGKIFTKIGREITVCVKESGADPSINSKLKELIAKAKSLNVPNDNIERVIKKASSSNDGDNYERNIYEGYGPSGVAVIVDTLTDNKNRTVGAIRHYFDKCGGNLGQNGSVSWQFKNKGIIVIDSEDVDENELMELSLDLGCDDFIVNDDNYEIVSTPENYPNIIDSLEKYNYNIISSGVEMIPDNYITIESEDDLTSLKKLLDMLDEDDDVQNVWHNCDNEIDD